MRISPFFLAAFSLCVHLVAPAAGQNVGGLVPTAKFDGQKIGKAFAKRIAGKQDFRYWANCSYRTTAKGEIILELGKKVANVQVEPCLFLVTQTQKYFNEYFVIEDPCEVGVAGHHACLNGYSVALRYRVKLQAIPDNSQYHLRILREIFAEKAAGDPGALGEGAKKADVAQINMKLVKKKLIKVGSIKSEFGFSPLTIRIRQRTLHADGSPASPWKEETSVQYVPYSDGSSQGSNICNVAGDIVADAVGNYADASLGFITTVNSVGGNAVGAVIGVRTGGKDGAVGGAVAGATAAAMFNAGASFLNRTAKPYAASFYGGVAESICNGITDPSDGLGETPYFPPDIFDPGGGFIDIDTGNMCFICTKVRENTATYYDSNGNYIDSDTTTECVQYGWVEC